ncbi:MAG: hypothetical protein QOC96_3522 [Acidobacteriota bacterium]|nr:hypothetical protein [Acidobacteriota bacterium]
MPEGVKVVGTASGREFDPTKAGGPLRKLTVERIKITSRGINVIERHVARFGDDAPNQRMISRLRAIADGKLKAGQADLNFYAHELREYVRYKKLGYSTGQPSGIEEMYELWNNTHTAALEEYELREGVGVLYDPSALSL